MLLKAWNQLAEGGSVNMASPLISQKLFHQTWPYGISGLTMKCTLHLDTPQDLWVNMKMYIISPRGCKYTQRGDKRTAKFFPCFDGPYEISKSFPQTSTYVLDLPGNTNIFSTFHASQLC